MQQQQLGGQRQGTPQAKYRQVENTMYSGVQRQSYQPDARPQYRQVKNPQWVQNQRLAGHTMSPAVVQPTAQQQQMFQVWMQQQQVIEQQNQSKKRPSQNDATAHGPPVKVIKKGPWPPTGTGPPRPTAAVTVLEEKDVEDVTAHDYTDNQQYMGAATMIDEFLYELIDPAEVQAGYGSEYN